MKSFVVYRLTLQVEIVRRVSLRRWNAVVSYDQATALMKDAEAKTSNLVTIKTKVLTMITTVEMRGKALVE